LRSWTRSRISAARSEYAREIVSGGALARIAEKFALGLGAIRTEEALTALVDALTDGSESLRQAVQPAVLQ